MSFYIAFDRDKNLELMLFNNIIYKENVFCPEPWFNNKVNPIGTFLLLFLNTDFNNEYDCGAFVYNFCFEEFYFYYYPEEDTTELSLYSFKLSPKEFVHILNKISKEEQKSL